MDNKIDGNTGFLAKTTGTWPIRLVAKTGAFQAPERGSKPLWATLFRCSLTEE